MGVAAVISALGCRSRLFAVDMNPQQEQQMRRFGVDEMICVKRSGSQALRYWKVAERIGGSVIPSKFGHQAFLGGFDVVYDCVGTGQSLTDAMKYARTGGTVVEVGTTQITLVDTAPLWFDELTVTGTNGRAIEQYEGQQVHTYELVFDLIQQGKLDLTGLLTHRFRIEQYREAFETLLNRGRNGAIKVAFVHD